MPAERHADAVRFILGEECDGLLPVRYVCEREYLPAGHGELRYDTVRCEWRDVHTDPRIQRMAECYLAAQRARRTGFADTTTGNAAAPAASIEADSENHPSGTTAER